ncbi:MAG TPA: hemin uptake protein HemP [Pirellulales bacterium]|jgi:hemin uptake protein HemP
MDHPEKQPPLSNPPDAGPSQFGLQVVRSHELLNGRQEVLIEHSGQYYRLRITRSGKLILQK